MSKILSTIAIAAILFFANNTAIASNLIEYNRLPTTTHQQNLTGKNLQNSQNHIQPTSEVQTFKKPTRKMVKLAYAQKYPASNKAGSRSANKSQK